MIRMSCFFSSASGASAGTGSVVATGGSSTAVISTLLLLPEHEPVDATVRAALDERVAGRLRPGVEVLDGARIGREDFEKLPRHERLHRLRGAHDRQRARETLRVHVLG